MGGLHKTLEDYAPYVVGTYDGIVNLNGVAHDINQNMLTGLDLLGNISDNTGNLGDIKSGVQSIDGKLSNTNTKLDSVNNKLGTLSNTAANINSHVNSIATNTQNTNTALQTTNQLLGELNNKEWSPNINVGAPEVNVSVAGDTNIINVEVSGDTAKSPSLILSFLKGLFGSDTSGWNGDTSGWNDVTSAASAAFDSMKTAGEWLAACDTTGGKRCDNMVLGAHGLDSAKSAMKGVYRALGDSLKNGAFGDSLANWGSKFTGNGVITGSGSNSCPSILTRSWHVTIGPTGFDLTIGRYLCQPIFGDTTAWTLCRLLLRASVALACMWFLFKCAVGFKGGDDD